MNNSGCVAYLTVILGAIVAFLGFRQPVAVVPTPAKQVTPTRIAVRATPTLPILPSRTPRPADPARPKLPLGDIQGKIAFVSRTQSSYDLYVINADGTGLENLTNNADIEWSPSWSPDGTQLAYAMASGDKDNYRYQIYVANADGSDPKQITQDGINWGVSWSPDGQHIAFGSNRNPSDGKFAIYVANPDGTNPVAVTDSAYDSRYPTWSPDSTRLAFEGKRSDTGQQYRIYSVNLDGTDETLVSKVPSAASCFSAMWSPVEDTLAFRCQYNSNASQDGIYTASPDGSNFQRLSAANTQDAAPSWSPDGRYMVVFDSTNFYPAAIYIIDVKSGARASLTSKVKAEGSPASWIK